MVGESSLLPRLASALRASSGPMSVLAIADSFLWRSWAAFDAGVVDVVVVVDGCASVSDSSSVSDSVSSEELLVSSSSSSSSSFFFTVASSRAAGGGCAGGGGAARLPRLRETRENSQPNKYQRAVPHPGPPSRNYASEGRYLDAGGLVNGAPVTTLRSRVVKRSLARWMIGSRVFQLASLHPYLTFLGFHSRVVR